MEGGETLLVADWSQYGRASSPAAGWGSQGSSGGCLSQEQSCFLWLFGCLHSPPGHICWSDSDKSVTLRMSFFLLGG